MATSQRCRSRLNFEATKLGPILNNSPFESVSKQDWPSPLVVMATMARLKNVDKAPRFAVVSGNRFSTLIPSDSNRANRTAPHRYPPRIDTPRDHAVRYLPSDDWNLGRGATRCWEVFSQSRGEWPAQVPWCSREIQRFMTDRRPERVVMSMSSKSGRNRIFKGEWTDVKDCHRGISDSLFRS